LIDASQWTTANAKSMCSEMQLGGQPDSFIQFAAPPPNFFRRLIWKWALGVTWKDLRPEHDLETLKGLK